MMERVESRLDCRTLIVRILCASGGAAAASASWPDGGELTAATKPQPDGTLLKALARAWVAALLDEGIDISVSDIGDAENISKSYVSRILRLALLAPDIVDRILAGPQIRR